jgi:hypothetical protein
MEAIKQTFAKCKQEKRSALVTYVTAGYPTNDETVDILLGLENGGAGTPMFIAIASFCRYRPDSQSTDTAASARYH